MAPNYGKKGRRRLDELQKALGRDVGDVGGREATTRRKLMEKQGGPLSIDPDVVAPSDQDMWEPDNETYEEEYDDYSYQDYEEEQNYEKEYEEDTEDEVVDCAELFPEIFIHKEIEMADRYFQGPDKSTRITEYKFVSTKECTSESTEVDLEGYLYVRWESNGAVSRYGPLSAANFKLFRDSESLGAQCISSKQKSDKVVIRLMNHGYVANADWPDD